MPIVTSTITVVALTSEIVTATILVCWSLYEQNVLLKQQSHFLRVKAVFLKIVKLSCPVLVLVDSNNGAFIDN